MKDRANLRRLGVWAAFACSVLVVLGLPAVAAADNEAHASVIGGHTASTEEFPSLSFIESQHGKEGFSCSGTVVAPRVILTAAHCVQDIEKGSFTDVHSYAVGIGTANLHQVTKANVFRVVATHVFPGFDPGRVHGDAALLILATATPAPPISLAGPADGALYTDGTQVSIAGWGLTRASNQNTPAVLHMATMAVQKPSYCSGHTQSFYNEYSSALQLCLLDPPAKKSGSCFGDSGGPAIGRRADGTAVELGVISVVGPRCSPSTPNVLTRVDTISAWVSEWIVATESGGPAPAPPSGPLPRMTREIGEEFALYTLTDVFGGRFAKASRVVGECRPVSAIRVKCEVAWITGRTVYGGTVFPFYVRSHQTTAWNSHYAIRWAARRCILENKPHCPIHSKRG